MKQSQAGNMHEKSKAKIIGFVCNWHSIGDVDEFLDKDYPSDIKFIRVMCAARIDRPILLKAAEGNIDGILIIICKENECRYKDGSIMAKKRINHTARLVNSLGFNENRIKIIEINDPTDIEPVSEAIHNFSQKIKSLP